MAITQYFCKIEDVYWKTTGNERRDDIKLQWAQCYYPPSHSLFCARWRIVWWSGDGSMASSLSRIQNRIFQYLLIARLPYGMRFKVNKILVDKNSCETEKYNERTSYRFGKRKRKREKRGAKPFYQHQSQRSNNQNDTRWKQSRKTVE